MEKDRKDKDLAVRRMGQGRKTKRLGRDLGGEVSKVRYGTKRTKRCGRRHLKEEKGDQDT